MVAEWLRFICTFYTLQLSSERRGFAEHGRERGWWGWVARSVRSHFLGLSESAFPVINLVG